MSSNNESVKTNILKEFLDWCSDSDKQTNAFIEKNFERIYGISPSLVNNNSLTHCLGVENIKSFEAFSESFLRENPIDQIEVSKAFKKFDKDSAIEAIENSIGTKKELLFNKNGKLKIDSVITNESDIIPALIALASEIKINPPAEYKTAKEYFQETNQADKLEELNQYINSYEKFITSIILSLDKSIKKSFEKVYLKDEKSYEEFINKVGEFALQMSDCKTENEITDFNKRFKNLVSAHATNQQWNTDSNKEPNDMIKTSRAHLFGCDISIFDLKKNKTEKFSATSFMKALKKNKNVEDPRSLTEKFSATSFMEALKNINNHDINNYVNGNLYTIIKTIEAYQIKNVGKTPHDKLSEADVITILYATFKLFSNEEFQLEDKVKLYGKNGVAEKRNSALEVLLSFGDIINDIRFRRNINSDICYQQGLALAEQVLETEKQKQKEAENEALRQAQGSASEPTPTHIDITPEDQQEQATETPSEQQAETPEQQTETQKTSAKQQTAAAVKKEDNGSSILGMSKEEREQKTKENEDNLSHVAQDDIYNKRQGFLGELTKKINIEAGNITQAKKTLETIIEKKSLSQVDIDNLNKYQVFNPPLSKLKEDETKILSDDEKGTIKIKSESFDPEPYNLVNNKIANLTLILVPQSIIVSNSKTENYETSLSNAKEHITLMEDPQKVTVQPPMPKMLKQLLSVLLERFPTQKDQKPKKSNYKTLMNDLLNTFNYENKLYEDFSLICNDEEVNLDNYIKFDTIYNKNNFETFLTFCNDEEVNLDNYIKFDKIYKEFGKQINTGFAKSCTSGKSERSFESFVAFAEKRRKNTEKKAKINLGKPAGKANAQQEQANEKPVEQKVETSQTENVMEEKIEKPANETVSEKKVDEQVAEKEVATTIVEEKPTQTETSDSSNDDSIEQ